MFWSCILQGIAFFVAHYCQLVPIAIYLEDANIEFYLSLYAAGHFTFVATKVTKNA